jgi:hypothetical protein
MMLEFVRESEAVLKVVQILTIQCRFCLKNTQIELYSLDVQIIILSSALHP